MTADELYKYVVTHIMSRLDALEAKVASNTEFRWRIYGGVALVTIVVGLLQSYALGAL